MNRTGPAPHTSRPLGGLVAPIADAVCFVAFVFFGRDQHGIHGGLSWFLTVLWPLLVGWFVLALAIRLYTRVDRTWARLAVTWVAGVLLGLVLRQLLTSHGDSFSTFTVVVLVFTGLTTFGWRAVLIGVRRASRGRGTRVPEAA
jgi:FtsH-binding integral membrane protein